MVQGGYVAPSSQKTLTVSRKSNVLDKLGRNKSSSTLNSNNNNNNSTLSSSIDVSIPLNETNLKICICICISECFDKFINLCNISYQYRKIN